MEGYDAHSKYQAAVYTKCVIYMILNMFVIPVLTISSGGKTIYQLIMESNFPRLLSELFIPKAGEFFTVLLFQQGVFSVMFYALEIPDVVFSYCIVELAFQ